jgi:multidrug resistance efflux pump
LSVRAAELGLQQAEAALLLAEINLEQAQTNRQHFEKALEQTRAEIRLLDVQMEKLEIHAHVVGTIRTRSVEPGEVLPVGAVAMTIDRTDTLTIKVFIAEDRYGQILLGDHAQVKVDSFPGEIFNATVTRIADQAEFTPRNVQTEEGRRTTVFAVELSVDDPSQRLKPGMPADVSFSEPVAE